MIDMLAEHQIVAFQKSNVSRPDTLEFQLSFIVVFRGIYIHAQIWVFWLWEIEFQSKMPVWNFYYSLKQIEYTNQFP